MKTKCTECGSNINVDNPTDSDMLNRISAIEKQIYEKKEELAEHLKNCPNCQNAISDIVKKKFDVDEKETDDEKDEDEDEEDD